MNEIYIPVWERYLLTIEEAAEYCHVGVSVIRAIMHENDDIYVTNGNRKLIKRTRLEKYIDEAADITA